MGREKRKSYVVMLPDYIDDSMFFRLSACPSDVAKGNILNSYDGIDSRHITTANSSEKAISNVIFRKLGKNITAKSLLKMLKPDAELFAFEIPKFDDREGFLDVSETDILRNCELASLIAEKRGGTYEDHYDEARDFMKRYYNNIKSFFENK